MLESVRVREFNKYADEIQGLAGIACTGGCTYTQKGCFNTVRWARSHTHTHARARAKVSMERYQGHQVGKIFHRD